MPPGIVSRESQFGMRKAFSNEVELSSAFVPLYRSALIVVLAVSATATSQAETGLASYYGGRGHHGEMTCAHRTRPFGSVVTVTHAGHSLRCRVNYRGPFVKGRVIDVSLSAARALRKVALIDLRRVRAEQGGAGVQLKSRDGLSGRIVIETTGERADWSDHQRIAAVVGHQICTLQRPSLDIAVSLRAHHQAHECQNSFHRFPLDIGITLPPRSCKAISGAWPSQTNLLGSDIDLTKCWILATGRCDCTADGRQRVYAESSIRGQSLRGSVAGRRHFNGGLAQPVRCSRAISYLLKSRFPEHAGRPETSGQML